MQGTTRGNNFLRYGWDTPPAVLGQIGSRVAVGLNDLAGSTLLPIPNIPRAFATGNLWNLLPYYSVVMEARNRAAMYMVQGVSPRVAITAAFLQTNLGGQSLQTAAEVGVGRSLAPEDLYRPLTRTEIVLRVVDPALTAAPVA